MKTHYFKRDAFVIENFNQQKPFSNFLPGIGGKMGIPLWVFYVNRGQGIAGFGLQDKNHPIMPFTPANKAYENASITGFRTFIKVNGGLYEPFKVDGEHLHKMFVHQDAFAIEEVNETLGLKTEVYYYGLTNEPLAGLIRRTRITNTSNKILHLEVLDGIAEILPAGVQNESFKSVSNLLASWMDVEHLNRQIAYFKLRASTNDTSEISGVEEGNFYIGMHDTQRIRPIVDPALVFGFNTSKTTPIMFMQTPLAELIKKPQVAVNKVPCSFIPVMKTLHPGETLEVNAVSGHAGSINILSQVLPKISTSDFFDSKLKDSQGTVQRLIEDVDTDTAESVFNNYVKQNYMDNFLRGGYPEKIGNSIYHLYSRRHGDLERDYNFFSLAPEYYSQGGGNFRDVCQNRRLDTFIHPEVADFNIHHFASLIQLDGYNPLTVEGIVFTLKEGVDTERLVKQLFKNNTDKIIAFLNKPYTPGNIVNFVERENIEANVSTKMYLDEIIEHSTPSIKAAFGEGFWVDHFTYVLDLIDSYESIYPDQMKTLLYEREDYAYFDSPVSVLPKAEKIVLNKENNVRQYGSLRHFDEEKLKRLKMNPHVSNWSKIADQTYTSNLFTKLFVLALTKHSLLDPDGIGIEMEAEKPGWNDAMNGLPGLIGSGVSETIELWRIVTFMLKHIDKRTVLIPNEIASLFKNLIHSDSYNDRVRSREQYREAIRFGLEGGYTTLHLKDIEGYLKNVKKHIEDKTVALMELHQGILPTFLYYEVTSYETVFENSKPKLSNKGYPLVQPLTYQQHALPYFLEAPARLLKTDLSQTVLRKMAEAIRESDIYDNKLNIYKTSGCLENQGHEIGRIRAFTKGWLERESNFLHMTYKYLLGLLKAGLYEEYYEALKTNLVCFMDPAVYGRSTLENSSFIAPSNNPDPALHGQGFFARLTGSTVETLNMWTIMMTGGNPFRYENDTLVLRFEPKLAANFFKKNHTLRFKFLKHTDVTYINHDHSDTFNRCDIYKIECFKADDVETIQGDQLSGQQAKNVRDGIYNALKIYMNKKIGGKNEKIS